jgi:hypothetical protein
MADSRGPTGSSVERRADTALVFVVTLLDRDSEPAMFMSPALTDSASPRGVLPRISRALAFATPRTRVGVRRTSEICGVGRDRVQGASLQEERRDGDADLRRDGGVDPVGTLTVVRTCGSATIGV